MQKNIVKKGLVFAVILLFMVIAVSPSLGVSNYLDDTTPPVTTISFNPPEPDGLNGWYVSSVTVTLNATDDDSGVNVTYYRIDNGVLQIYTGSFTLNTDGPHVINYYSIDNAGNQEEVRSAEINIDKTKPEIGLSWEVVGGNKFKGWDLCFKATANDYVSGMNRVEFYIDNELRETVYGLGPTYTWVYYHYPIVGLRVRGIIHNPEITDEYVEFFAILIIIISIQDWYQDICVYAYDDAGNIGEDCIEHPCSIMPISSGIYLFTNVILPNNYTGYIGKFFIRATFDF